MCYICWHHIFPFKMKRPKNGTELFTFLRISEYSIIWLRCDFINIRRYDVKLFHLCLDISEIPQKGTCEKRFSSCPLCVSVFCFSRSSATFLRYFSQSSTEGPTSLNKAGGTGEGPCSVGTTAPPSCSASNKTPVTTVTNYTAGRE